MIRSLSAPLTHWHWPLVLTFLSLNDLLLNNLQPWSFNILSLNSYPLFYLFVCFDNISVFDTQIFALKITKIFEFGQLMCTVYFEVIVCEFGGHCFGPKYFSEGAYISNEFTQWLESRWCKGTILTIARGGLRGRGECPPMVFRKGKNWNQGLS